MDSTRFAELDLRSTGRSSPDQSTFAPENLTTLAHFSVSSAIGFAKSAGDPPSNVSPRSAIRAGHPAMSALQVRRQFAHCKINCESVGARARRGRLDASMFSNDRHIGFSSGSRRYRRSGAVPARANPGASRCRRARRQTRRLRCRRSVPPRLGREADPAVRADAHLALRTLAGE
jgi:hypothetical protein